MSELEKTRTVAMAEYALYVGMSLSELLLRVHAAKDEAEALALITDWKVLIDGQCYADPAYRITHRVLKHGSLLQAGEHTIHVLHWVDGDE